VRSWHNDIKRRNGTEVRALGGRGVEPDPINRAKANYVIEGTGGDGLKWAMVFLWERRCFSTWPWP
jgi:hypothetical protein